MLQVALIPLCHACDKFYQAPLFSACNIEKLLEPGDEAKSRHITLRLCLWDFELGHAKLLQRNTRWMK